MGSKQWSTLHQIHHSIKSNSQAWDDLGILTALTAKSAILRGKMRWCPSVCPISTKIWGPTHPSPQQHGFSVLADPSNPKEANLRHGWSWIYFLQNTVGSSISLTFFDDFTIDYTVDQQRIDALSGKMAGQTGLHWWSKNMNFESISTTS